MACACGDVGGVGRGREQRPQGQILQRRGIDQRAAAVVGTGQVLAQAGGVSHAQGHVRGERALNTEVPVLVIRRLAAELRVAVGGVLHARGIRRDVTGPVSGIEERRRLGDGRNAAIPVICRSVVAGAGGVVGGGETELAESLAGVVAPADAAHVHVHNRIARPQDGLVVQTVRRSQARAEVLVVTVDGSPCSGNCRCRCRQTGARPDGPRRPDWPGSG